MVEEFKEKTCRIYWILNFSSFLEDSERKVGMKEWCGGPGGYIRRGGTGGGRSDDEKQGKVELIKGCQKG